MNKIKQNIFILIISYNNYIFSAQNSSKIIVYKNFNEKKLKLNYNAEEYCIKIYEKFSRINKIASIEDIKSKINIPELNNRINNNKRSNSIFNKYKKIKCIKYKNNDANKKVKNKKTFSTEKCLKNKLNLINYQNIINNSNQLSKSLSLKEIYICKSSIAYSLGMIKSKEYVMLVCIISPELNASFFNISANLIFSKYAKNIKKLSFLLKNYIAILNDLKQVILLYKNTNSCEILNSTEFRKESKIHNIVITLYETLFEFFIILNETRPLVNWFYKLFLNSYNYNKIKLKEVNCAQKMIIFLNLISGDDYKKIFDLFYFEYLSKYPKQKLITTKKNLVETFLNTQNDIFLYRTTLIIRKNSYYLYYLSYIQFDKYINELLGECKKISCIWSNIINLSIKNEGSFNEKLKLFLNNSNIKVKIKVTKNKNNRLTNIIALIFPNEYKKFTNIKSHFIQNKKNLNIKIKSYNFYQLNRFLKHSFELHRIKVIEFYLFTLCFEKIN